jgi:hypothetical protein
MKILAGPPAGSVDGPPAASRPVLTVVYTVERTGLIGLSGYRVSARIDNPGEAPVSDWEISFTLSAGQKVEEAANAEYAQDGTILALTPGNAVPAHGSLTISFQVSGLLAAEPTGCMIDRRPCG